jgi:regulation of enolase protein 1 (concanavalin A-like superfamily)
LNGNAFSWTPDYTQVGSYPVTFIAGDGELQDTQTITITVGDAANPNAAFVDNFDGSSLNKTLWTFINPLNDASIALSGGILKIAVPAGKNHDIGTNGNYAPRIMTPIADTDFQIEAKFNSELSLRYQMQGLLVEQDSKNFIRFDVYSSGSYTLWYLGSYVNGSPSISKWKTITKKAPYYVRIERVGNVFTFYYSYDGITWITATSFTRTMTPDSAGVYIANHGTTSSNAPAFTGMVEYFSKK